MLAQLGRAVPYLVCAALVPMFGSLGPISEAAMRESPLEAKYNHSKKYKIMLLDVLTSENLRDLHADGIVIIDDVLTKIELDKARKDIDLLKQQRKFEKTEQDGPDIRTDFVYWINQPISNEYKLAIGEGLAFVHSFVRSIPSELINTNISRMHYTNLGVPFSNQLSCYNSPGARYTAHRDKGDEIGWWSKNLQYFMQPGLQEREFTIILYLNDGKWADGRGVNDKPNDGCLRCYLGAEESDDSGQTASKVLDITPDGGRMVIFDAKNILHEVMATDRERIALTCWIGGSNGNFKYLRTWCIPRDSPKA